MAATFRPINLLPARANTMGAARAVDISITMPRPNVAPQQAPLVSDDQATPTKATFQTSALAAQKPLPSSPFLESVKASDKVEPKTLKRANSHHSRKSKDSDDMDIVDSDGEEVSDDESVNADGTRTGPKKKSQRFYCIDYPPCNLSFTRSEHLARHIRKHTGERPFQCHCSRRFSRLDNLRQHAQTVHVNEDIPTDSLAAQGTRFQRQIRTDRVRQAGGRARASTAGALSVANRGHSKSLSTSSIASVSSLGSSYSANEARRRPPPLVMADPRSRRSLESHPNVDGNLYRPASPSDLSTPTSATFSTGQNSPRWGSGVASPTTSHSRSHSMYAGSQTPSRRLSVPSGVNPFQSPHGLVLRAPMLGPGPPNAVSSGPYSPSKGLMASPTASNSYAWSRRDSITSAADEAWKRRTWHPDTRDPNGASRLSHVVTPSQMAANDVAPPIAPVSSSSIPRQQLQAPRLPGIESFMSLPHRPVTPPRRNPSPMMVDSEGPKLRSQPPLLSVAEMSDDQRSVTAKWDMGLHRGLTRLELDTPPRDSAGAWATEAQQAVLAQAEQARLNAGPPTVRFSTEVTTMPAMPSNQPPASLPSIASRHHHTMSAPSMMASRDIRRHGCEHGPLSTHPAGETIPECRTYVDRIVHPNVSRFQGFPTARNPHTVIHQQPESQRQGGANDLRRLEALVAAATSAKSATKAY